MPPHVFNDKHDAKYGTAIHMKRFPQISVLVCAMYGMATGILFALLYIVHYVTKKHHLYWCFGGISLETSFSLGVLFHVVM